MGKAVIAGIVILVGIGWLIAAGFLHVQDDPHGCLFGRSWQTVGSREVLWQVGKLKLLYQPVRWDCPKEESYDPALYEVRDGVLELRATPAPTK